MSKERPSPNTKLSRIEENAVSEDDQDDDDMFLHDLERENQMLEGVLRDLQGAIKQDKTEISFDLYDRKPKGNRHFTSLRQITLSTPNRQDSLEKSSKLRSSVDSKVSNYELSEFALTV